MICLIYECESIINYLEYNSCNWSFVSNFTFVASGSTPNRSALFFNFSSSSKVNEWLRLPEEFLSLFMSIYTLNDLTFLKIICNTKRWYCTSSTIGWETDAVDGKPTRLKKWQHLTFFYIQSPCAKLYQNPI